MKNLRRAALALGLGLATAPGVRAAAPRPAATDAAITIPFAPSIGTPLRLHIERHLTGAGAAEETATSDDELVFTERDTAGYVLRWTTRAATIKTAPERQAIMDSVLAATIGKPALIQTDAHGAPIGLINMGEMRAALADALDAVAAAIDTKLAAKPQAERDAVRNAVAQFADLYRGMTDEQLNDVLLDQARTLFGAGGSVLARGRPEPFQTSIILPIVNQPIDVAGHIELREAGPAGLTIATSSISDPADVKAAAAAYLDRILAGIDPARRDAVTAAVGALQGFEQSDDLVITLDPQSGIVRHAEYRKRIAVAGRVKTETKTYTLAR